METGELYESLRRLQEPKGFFFNRDRNLVDELLAGLLTNRRRYGYMACPCRLAAGERQLDEDIICPCHYRAADVEEFGSCYCGLYVSRAWNEESGPRPHVPERRPPEKSFL